MFSGLRQNDPICTYNCIKDYTEISHCKLTRGHLGWTVSVCYPGTLQSSAYLSLSSGAGSVPHPLECLEQSFSLSDTGCLFLVSWRNRREWRARERETDKKKKEWGHNPNLWLSHCTSSPDQMCVRRWTGFKEAGREVKERDEGWEWGGVNPCLLLCWSQMIKMNSMDGRNQIDSHLWLNGITEAQMNRSVWSGAEWVPDSFAL